MNFKELPINGQAFEQLVRELIFSRGLHVHWSGRGPDGGRDLLCRETLTGLFGPETRVWLVQCKHKAHSGDSVGIGDLDDIVASCVQHGATGYLLACSTQPSSAVINRLEGISKSPNPMITATYWDAVMLERLLSNSRDWSIAQRFMPVSCAEWRLYATESPNNFVAHYRGYVFQLTNRIGSATKHHLPSIASRISEFEALPLPKGHFIRPRAVWYDDKNGGYQWYIDYLRPRGEPAAMSKAMLLRALKDGWALDDGQTYHWDISLVQYSEFSDHYDKDHYDFYTRYIPNFLNGKPRSSEDGWGEYYATKQEIEDLDEQQIITKSSSFDLMISTFKKVPYLNVLNAINSDPEQIHKLERRFNWCDVMGDLSIRVENLFTAKLVIGVVDDVKFHNLVKKIPNNIDFHFRLSRVYLYIDGHVSVDENEFLYDLILSVHPSIMTNQKTTRDSFNTYFDSIQAIVEQELDGCCTSPGSELLSS